jgi:hypothetical protein
MSETADVSALLVLVVVMTTSMIQRPGGGRRMLSGMWAELARMRAAALDGDRSDVVLNPCRCGNRPAS